MSFTAVGYFGYSNRSHKAACDCIAADPTGVTVLLRPRLMGSRVPPPERLTYDRITLPDGTPITYQKAAELLAEPITSRAE